jgi:hypothetical protein
VSADPPAELSDDAALARYLVALRDSGSALTPELAAAFDELTPAQLDVLVALLVDAAAPSAAHVAPARAKTPSRDVDAAPPADRAPWPLRGWAALLIGASLVTGASVWATTAALDGLLTPSGTSVVAERGEAPIDPGDLGIDLSGLDAADW